MKTWMQCESKVKAMWMQCESIVGAMWKRCKCNVKTMTMQCKGNVTTTWLPSESNVNANLNAMWFQCECNLKSISMQSKCTFNAMSNPHPPPTPSPPAQSPHPPKLLIALGRLMDIYIGVWGGKPNGKCSARDVCVRGFVALGGVDSDTRSILEGTRRTPPAAPPRGPRHKIYSISTWMALSGGRGRGRGHGRGRGQIYRISSWIALKS